MPIPVAEEGTLRWASRFTYFLLTEVFPDLRVLGVWLQLPRGHLRVLRDEHRRVQHSGVPHLHRQDLRAARQAVPAAAHVRDQGLGARHDQLRGAVRQHPAVVANQNPESPRPRRAFADPSRPEEAGRDVRVHLVRVLQHRVPLLLVERRLVPRPRRPHAGPYAFSSGQPLPTPHVPFQCPQTTRGRRVVAWTLPLCSTLHSTWPSFLVATFPPASCVVCMVVGVPVDRGLARRVHQGAARAARRLVQALPLPHHHELHQDLPQALEPGKSHRAHQKESRRIPLERHCPL